MRQKMIVIRDGLSHGRSACVIACRKYLTLSPTKLDALTVVSNDRRTPRSECVGGSRCAIVLGVLAFSAYS